MDGQRKLKMYYDQELPHWDPPCTGHFYDVYDEIILCTGWKYILPDMFDDNCKPGKNTSPPGSDNIFYACSNIIYKNYYWSKGYLKSTSVDYYFKGAKYFDLVFC